MIDVQPVNNTYRLHLTPTYDSMVGGSVWVNFVNKR